MLIKSQLTLKNHIYYPKTSTKKTGYLNQWEQEAENDHIKSAIAISTNKLTLNNITEKIMPIWNQLPNQSHFSSILEIGCGYGRIPLYLSLKKQITCNSYFGIDISAKMLDHFKTYINQFHPFRKSKFHLITTSADHLPIKNNSIDLVISSAVFLHMGKKFTKKTFTEIARVLKPGGSILFDSSFPNKYATANLLDQIVTHLPKKLAPNYLKYYSKSELNRLVQITGLAQKIGSHQILDYQYLLLPKSFWKLKFPFTKPINKLVQNPPGILKPILSVGYHLVAINP